MLWVLFAGEMYLRAINPIPMLPRYIVATDYGVRGNQPNARYVHTTPDYQNEFRINSKGIRSDDEIPYESATGLPRVLLLGDSFALGHDATLEQSFLWQAQQSALTNHRLPVDIINMGVSGHGTAEELLTLRAEGVKYKPDVVVVAWHETDLVDNVRSGLFQLSDHGDVVQVATSYLPAVKVQKFLFSFAAYRWLAGSSHLYNWLRAEVAERVKGLLYFARLLRSFARADGGETAPHGGAAPGIAYEDGLALALLREIQRVCDSIDATLIVVDIPVFQPGPLYGTRFPYAQFLPSDRFQVIRLDQVFQKRPEQLYWLRSHFHLTTIGNQLTGQILAEAIAQAMSEKRHHAR